MPEPTKTCCECKKPKPLGAFHARAKSKDGRQNKCRDCVKKYNRSPAGLAAKARYASTHKRLGAKQKDGTRPWVPR